MATLCGDFGFIWEFEDIEQAVDWYEIYLYEDNVAGMTVRYR